MIVEFCKWTLEKYGDNLGDLVELLDSLSYSFYKEANLHQYSSKEELLNSVTEHTHINVICLVG